MKTSYYGCVSMLLLCLNAGGQTASSPSTLANSAVPEGEVMDAQIIGGKGFVAASECLYEFAPDTPEKWTSRGLLGGAYISRILGMARNGDLLLEGGRTNNSGLVKPALFRYRSGNSEVDFVSVLASSAVAFSDKGLGIAGDGADLCTSEDDGQASSWGSWTPEGNDGKKDPVVATTWIDGGNFVVADGGHHLSLVNFGRSTHRVVWRVTNDDMSKPLASTKQAFWTVGVDQKSQWLDEHRLSDGSVVKTTQIPIDIHQLFVTANFIVGVGDNPNPREDPVCWFVLNRGTDQIIRKQNSRVSVHGVIETSTKHVWLFVGNGVIMQADAEKVEAKRVTVDNTAFITAITKLHEANSPTPEESAEVQRLLPRVQGRDQTALLQRMSQQPGTARQRVEWLLEQLRKLPDQAPATGQSAPP